MERALLTRHAESQYSAKNLLNGDPYAWNPLTRKGRKQAKHLGELLRDESIDLCVTTRFPRTRETADIALQGRPVPRLVVPELDDVKVGAFEGKSVEDYREWQLANGPADAVPDGESRVDAIKRSIDGYRTILAREETVILVVAHGLPITAVLLALRGEGIPPTLKGVQVEPAEPHPVTAEELTTALRALRAWTKDVRGS
ncbi:MAG TPA: histidine phosphatase family protein [Actinomycetota bacterium]|nr:histidine phosphatase family protein [Actinomycetota bacterium]